mgnify:CR=1 FL=1
MSVNQYQRQVNILDKEIADLEKKKASKDKECANFQTKINNINRSINKNTSPSLLNSKMRQISAHENNYARKSADSASLGSKIAEKKKKRATEYLKLQKAEQSEQRKIDITNKRIYSDYETRIDELQNLIKDKIVRNTNDQLSSDEKYDVFISHAWEDKESFVQELVNEMESNGLKVWYDTDRIKWGDSLREHIDNGLKKSRYGIVVLSPDYISEKKYWTKAEMNALFQLESVNGKVVLPIWHNLTKKEVLEYSPIIADKKAMTTAMMTAKEIADELKNLLPTVEEGEIDNE